MQEETILWGKYQRLGEVFCNRVVPCMRSYSPVQGKPRSPSPPLHHTSILFKNVSFLVSSLLRKCFVEIAKKRLNHDNPHKVFSCPLYLFKCSLLFHLKSERWCTRVTYPFVPTSKTVICILFLSHEGLVKHSRYAKGNVRVPPILKLYDNFSCAVVPYLVESGKSTITSLHCALSTKCNLVSRSNLRLRDRGKWFYGCKLEPKCLEYKPV